METNEINERLEEIRNCADDFEEAHYREKQLLIDFIASIAEDWTGDLSDRAKLVLTVGNIDFKRYFA